MNNFIALKDYVSPESFNVLFEMRTKHLEGKLIPFVGAGFTKNILSSMPDWRSILRHVSRKVNWNEDLLELHGDQYQIIEYLSTIDRLGLSELIKTLEMELAQNREIPDSSPHFALAKLAPHKIYTTNWDDWIEKSFTAAHLPYSKVYEVDNKICERPTNKNTPGTEVVKFHGDFLSPKSIVFTQSTYFDRLSGAYVLDAMLAVDISRMSFIFLGYSFNDINVRLLWSKERSDCRPLSCFVSLDENPIRDKVLEKINIKVVRLLHEQASVEACLNAVIRFVGQT